LSLNAGSGARRRPLRAATVRVEPLGAEITLLPGESLAEAAWRLGFHWPTTCFGQAECMMCRVRVVSGENLVVPPDDEESNAMRTRLPSASRRPGVRLACRLKVTADGVTVEKTGVRPPDGLSVPPRSS
jgi:2Fe-2S ferredoxin